MHLQTHALLSWLVAEAVPGGGLERRRDRAVVLAAGLIPDLDAITIVDRELYERWHRVPCHNVAFAALVVGLALVASRRLAVAVAAAITFHLHLACDIAGAAGPDGSNWGVPYLVPFLGVEDAWIRASWQWGLASWQNVAITIAALLACVHVGAQRGRTIVGVLAPRADEAFVAIVRKRWPLSPRPEPPPGPDAPPT